MNKLFHITDIIRISRYKKHIRGGGYKLGYAVYCQYSQNISIGEGTYINSGDICASPNASLIIGKNCLISYNVHLRTDQHNYKSKSKIILEQGANEKSIIIGNDVWIGYGAQILSGCNVADGCVIGAGAILTHSTEPYCVYAGVPAKKIGERN